MHPELRAELSELMASPTAESARFVSGRRQAGVTARVGRHRGRGLAIATSQQAMLERTASTYVVSAPDAIVRLKQGHRHDVVLLDLSTTTTDAVAFMRMLRDFDLGVR
jgi:CheY-like chemotaxis protein